MNAFLRKISKSNSALISKCSKISVPKKAIIYVKTNEEIEAMERHKRNWMKTN